MSTAPVLRAETLNHPHVVEERADLFHSYDSCTTEDEYLHVIYSLIYALKPVNVLETGSYQGIGTAFIARALRKNGIGKLTTLEIAPKMVEATLEQVRVNGVAHLVDVWEGDSLMYLAGTGKKFDFAFFDSLLQNRCKELRICLERHLLPSGSFFAMHDTSKTRAIRINKDSMGKPTAEIPEEHIEYDPYTISHWDEMDSLEGIKYLHIPFSRGLTIGQVL